MRNVRKDVEDNEKSSHGHQDNSESYGLTWKVGCYSMYP